MATSSPTVSELKGPLATSPTSQKRQTLPPSRINVLIMEKISQRAVKLLEAEGFHVEQAVKFSEDELVEKIPAMSAIGVRSKTKLTARVLKAAKNLLCIGTFCIGTDQTDLKVAASMGIPVFNSPYANTRSVAELVIAEMIMMARQAGDRSKEVHAGIWNKRSDGCYEVRGKTLGIVGYGHVGSQLSILAEAMGMNVVFHDHMPKLSLGQAKQQRSLDELLEVADFVSLHVPATPSTRMMITAEQIAKMKKGSYLLNLARGSVVDIDAAAAALKSGHLAGGAFDVYPVEPAGKSEGWVMPLQGCPNTILTPHIGGSTEEAQEAIGIEVASKLIGFINKGVTVGAVNLPEVTVNRDLRPGEERVLCFHQNVPGVLARMTNVLSTFNVCNQYLATEGKLGYMIIDVEGQFDEEAKMKILSLESDIRTRILYQGPGYQGPGL